MDRSQLAARIKEILEGRPRPAAPVSSRDEPAVVVADRCRETFDEEAAFAARCAADEATSDAAQVLGGTTVQGPRGPCLVVDRQYPADHVHGRFAVARYAAAAEAGLRVLPWFLQASSRGPSADPAGAPLDLRSGDEPDAAAEGPIARLLFFDLETTGLSGGAGTCAFLVGCGYFDAGVFRTQQFFLRGYGEEPALLEAVRAWVREIGDGGPGCLVTYNGRAFDLPLIETRYLFHRSTSPLAALPHVDMLFSARRLWRRRAGRDFTPAFDPFDRLASVPPAADLRASCALTALEQDILGLQRHDDVPGWEIPARFFAYARTGDARGLVAVMEHNRLDLLSLAAITGLILEQALEQDRVARDRPACLALARLLDYLGRSGDAERCYERAAAADGLAEGTLDRIARAEALHWLALHRRRARRFADAAEAWSGLLQVPGLDGALRREACEALAIHHEHRARDLQAARSFALRALDLSDDAKRVDDVRHRLNRLSRKISTIDPDRAWID